MINKLSKVGIIGLGYVGLPLAIEFSKKFITIGYDISSKRINNLNNGFDSTKEVDEDFLSNNHLRFTSNINDLANCNYLIVTVPTPIDDANIPDLSYLEKACFEISKILKKNSLVVFESTVYPGLTDDICIPILELHSNLKINKDFFVGYSPERVNPGDKNRKIPSIKKVISGSNKKALKMVKDLYLNIIDAGVFEASSIKIAEASKIIENTQRDINIALINELSIIFSKMNLDTQEVLDAASTKWNFLPFTPGLVGGHCIGVDPYYLTHKSIQLGYKPEVILAGRRINDNMSHEVTKRTIKKMIQRKIPINNSKILIMGFTFKENCPDVRNTKIYDIYKDFKDLNLHVDVYDPIADSDNMKEYNDLNLIKKPKRKNYDVILICVSHEIFKNLGIKKIKEFAKKDSIIFDLKSTFSIKETDLRL